MKRNLLPFLAIATSLALLPCCFSCKKTDQNEPVEEQEQEQKEEQEQPQDDGKPKAGDYTFTVSPLKGQWEAGDKIHIHGSYGPAAETYTLQASDISADGKTATLKLDSVLEYLTAPDYLYASWPGEAVLEEDGLMDATTTFSVANIHLAQAYLQGTNFTFDDASAAIRFAVTGDYDRVIIAGAQRPGLRFTEYSNEHSSSYTSFSKVSTDGYPFREEPLAASGETTTIWFPGSATLKGGFTLYFGKDGAWPAIYTYTEEVSLKAGKTLELGDITASLTAYDGPEPKMPEMGKRTKYTVNVNELSGLYLSADGSFLWGVGDGGELARLSFTGEVLGDIVAIGGDAEAVSINPETGDLLIGLEPNSVGVVYAPDFNTRVKSLFNIEDASGFGNAGLEGLTYYKDGMVYAGTQTGSYLYLCNLETGEVIWRKGLREMYATITEIADLYYDPLTDWLWVIDSESRRCFALSGDAESMLGFYSVKGIENPESICVDHANSCIWVGDDYGSTSYLYRYDFTGLDDAILAE